MYSPGGQIKYTKPVPPEKGSFPLDHLGECIATKKIYMDCLDAHKSISIKCRKEAKEYLACRMERGLMSVEDMENLGFSAEDDRLQQNVVKEPSISTSKSSSPQTK